MLRTGLDWFRKVSESPTRPPDADAGATPPEIAAAPAPAALPDDSGTDTSAQPFDVADLYAGPASPEAAAAGAAPLDEKLRQAYFWIVNTAIISPFYDVEYDDGPAQSFVMGDQKCRVSLPSGQSYSSNVLLPLLNLVLRRRCLLVGGPGRGKTAIAILMGVLGGYTTREMKRSIQHGQPQMTIADLLGTPLPSTMVSAQGFEDIKIAWRSWLGMRVKVIDEYNRIPTRTQSALLTVLADNYAEMFDQVYECPEAAWYLTANDDAGGGTYQVIEALRDRIDVVVRALHFNTRFLGILLRRLEAGVRPEEVVPPQIVFDAAELDRIQTRVLAVTLPAGLRRRIEFFASQLEFFEPGGWQLEYKTKDTVKLSAGDLGALSAQETGKDRVKDLGSQTANGLSVRAMMTTLAFVKAAAWFRGRREVSLEDVRQIVPFVLHDKLGLNAQSPFFDAPGHEVLRVDRVSWIRRLFDLSCAEYDRLDLDRDDPVGTLSAEFEKGLDGLSERDSRSRLAAIERLLGEWSKGRKLYGNLYDDVLALKYLHQRYTNYLAWLQWKR